MIKKKKMKCRTGNTVCGKGVVGKNCDVKSGNAVVENGVSSSGNSGGSSHENLKTYKRRRCTDMNSSEAEVLENGNVVVGKFRQLPDKKKLKESIDAVSHNFVDDVSSGSDGPHLNDSRTVVLNQLSQSLPETEGGLLELIEYKTSINGHEDVDKCPSSPGELRPLAVTCNGSSSKSSRPNTDMCQQVFRDIFTSEKFVQLRGVLKTFEGANFDSILDIRPIQSRLKEGAYEKSPILFHSDMQKVWEHLQKFGADIDSLSKILMDKSTASYYQQFSESGLHTKLEQLETCGVPKACSCRQCGKKAEGKDCLVCDSCEEMYHVACIEPSIKEIPIKSWYCVKCVANGIGSPHDNCVVCEKLITTVPPNNGVDYEEISMDSNGLSSHEIELRMGDTICNICKTKVLGDKNIKVCGHSFCLHRRYHMNCLTNKQLRTYGPCWYCPSCLCRACLTDRDDNEIVMCDGCDSAYHIYCMQPPRTTIPEGSWFCIKCDVGIQKIAKAKMEYEKIQSKLEKRGKNGKGVVDEELVGKSGGVDMLLSAAITLKCEEKMVAAEAES